MGNSTEQLASYLLRFLGGRDNVLDAGSCMTRLRVQLADPDLMDQEALRSTPDVLGIQVQDDYVQVVLGPGKAKKVADAVVAQLGDGPAREAGDNGGLKEAWRRNKEQRQAGQRPSRVKALLRLIAQIFVPLLPAIIAAGLFNGIGSLIGQLLEDGVLSGAFWTMTQLFLGLMGSALLGFLAIFVGINAAKQFGATPALGGMIGGASIGANIVLIATQLGLYNADVPLSSVLTTGKGGIIGVIFGVWVLSLVEKGFRRHVPDVLDLIVTPFCSLLVTGVLFVFVIMPAAGFLSDGLVFLLSLLLDSGNPVVSVLGGYILSAVFLPMVLLGLHHGLIPIYAIQLEAMGGVSLFPVLAMAGAGQVGSAIAIYLMARRAGDERLCSVIAAALPAGFLGVGEPLIYGVTLPLGKPFVTAGLGAGFGGAYTMLTHVTASAWGPSGLVAIPLMQGPAAMVHYFIGLCIAYVGGFVVTWLLMRPQDLVTDAPAGAVQ